MNDGRVIRSGTAFIVDTNSGYLRLVEMRCAAHGISTLSFDDAEEFLATVEPNTEGCLIVDLDLPKLAGLAVHRELQRMQIPLETIITTGGTDARTCREGFKSGVLDVIGKDLDEPDFIPIVERALALSNQWMHHRNLAVSARRKLARLTATELLVAHQLASGGSLFDIGSELGITVQTSSKHKSRVFQKLEVESSVQVHKLLECINNQRTRATNLMTQVGY